MKQIVKDTVTVTVTVSDSNSNSVALVELMTVWLAGWLCDC